MHAYSSFESNKAAFLEHKKIISVSKNGFSQRNKTKISTLKHDIFFFTCSFSDSQSRITANCCFGMCVKKLFLNVLELYDDRTESVCEI